MVKASVYNAGDPGSIPGSGRSPGEGNSNPLQYYCLTITTDSYWMYANKHIAMKRIFKGFWKLEGSGREKSKCFVFVHKDIFYQIFDILREKRKRLLKIWRSKTVENQNIREPAVKQKATKIMYHPH